MVEVERKRINHCHICSKDCASPEDNPDRFNLDTPWEKLSPPTNFMNCPIFRKTVEWNKNIIPLLTT